MEVSFFLFCISGRFVCFLFGDVRFVFLSYHGGLQRACSYTIKLAQIQAQKLPAGSLDLHNVEVIMKVFLCVYCLEPRKCMAMGQKFNNRWKYKYTWSTEKGAR